MQTTKDYSPPDSNFGLSHFAVNGAYVWAAQNGLMLNGDGIKEVIPAKHKFERKYFKSYFKNFHIHYLVMSYLSPEHIFECHMPLFYLRVLNIMLNMYLTSIYIEMLVSNDVC